MTLLLAVVAAIHRYNPWTGGFTSHSSQGLVSWTATVEVTEGTYAFGVPGARDAVIAADGTTTMPVHLASGLHQIYIERGGPDPPDLTWSRDGGAATPVPRDALYARKPGAAVLALTRGVRASMHGLQWVWAITLIAAVLFTLSGAASDGLRRLRTEVDWSRLRWLVAVSVLLNAIPVWWGLPALWAPDELMPTTVLTGLSAHFANGWYDRWPPFHYYTLAAAWSPLLALGTWGRISFDGPFWPAALTLIARMVSLLYSIITVICVALVGTRAFGRRAGLLAAAALALLAPFLYYAKTANLDVPYIFWFALSLVMYQRLLERLAVRDAVLFGLFAMLAICTKDQAYALYPLMAVAIVVRILGEYRQSGTPAWRIVRDRRLVAGTLTGIAVFVVCHNLPFNWSGFVSHVRYITGPGNENYRVFAPTLAGRLSLLRLTMRLIEMSWGWPLTLVAAAGVLVAIAERPLRRVAFVLLAAPVAYYFAFINVVLYDYDRFVIPICLVLALFAGLAFDRLLTARRSAWRTAVVCGIVAYTFLYSATVDVLMLRDSRYMVDRWIRSGVGPGELLAASGPRELLPKLDRPWVDIATLPDLAATRPAYYVLSADYGRAVPIQQGWGQLIAALESGRAGYTLVARVRCPSPWPWLPGAHPDLTGPRPNDPETGVVSILRDVNPTIEVFARTPARPIQVGCMAGPATGR